MAKTQETGSRAYLFSIVLVAIIGGLLFGYDTACLLYTSPSPRDS